MSNLKKNLISIVLLALVTGVVYAQAPHGTDSQIPVKPEVKKVVKKKSVKKPVVKVKAEEELVPLPESPKIVEVPKEAKKEVKKKVETK